MDTNTYLAKQAKLNKRQDKIFNHFFMFLLCLLAFIYLIPLLWMFLTSLKSVNELSSIPIKIFPKIPQWENYSKVFELVPFAKSYQNSIIISISITVVVVLTSSMAGYSFAKLDYPFRDTIFTGILSSMMVPFFLLCIPLFYIFTQLKLIDTHVGLVLPFTFSAFGIFLMRQTIMGIPTDIIHAARIDGCSETRIFWTIILPLVKSGIGTLVIFTFMQSWDEFMWSLLAAQSEKMWTLPLVIRQLQMADQKLYHFQMAGATMAVLPLIILFIFAQKQIIQSVAAAGMKL